MTTNDQPQMIPADKIREVRDLHRDAAKMVTITDAEREIHQHVADAMDALLPAPKRPTLADMTPEARRDCQWMQADTKPWGRVIIIVPDLSHGRAALLDIWGDVAYEDHASVTPRPDLPRMEWPHTYQEAKAATPAKVGDVIESADDPRLAALPYGSMLIDRDGGPFDITKTGTGEWAGPGYVPAQGTGTKWGPWTVRRIGLGADQ